MKNIEPINYSFFNKVLLLKKSLSDGTDVVVVYVVFVAKATRKSL